MNIRSSFTDVSVARLLHGSLAAGFYGDSVDVLVRPLMPAVDVIHSATHPGRALEPDCPRTVPRASMRACSYHASPRLAKASVLCTSLWMI